MEADRELFRLTVLLEAAMEKEKTKWNPSCYSSEEDKVSP